MRIHLEPLDREDLEFVRGLRNALRDYFFDSKPITKQQQEEWYQEQRIALYNWTWVIWDSDQRIGVISRKLVGYGIPISETQVALLYEIGNLMLLPTYQSKGIMQEALQQVTAMAPRSFYIAHVKDTNTASLRLFKRAGFWRVPRAR